MAFDEKGWKVTKEISIGDLIAFGTAFIAVVYAYATLDKRQAVMEDRQVQQAAIDRRQDDDLLRFQTRIESSLSTLGAKLDRLIEQRNSPVGRYREGKVSE